MLPMVLRISFFYGSDASFQLYSVFTDSLFYQLMSFPQKKKKKKKLVLFFMRFLSQPKSRKLSGFIFHEISLAAKIEEIFFFIFQF